MELGRLHWRRRRRSRGGRRGSRRGGYRKRGGRRGGDKGMLGIYTFLLLTPVRVVWDKVWDEVWDEVLFFDGRAVYDKV